MKIIDILAQNIKIDGTIEQFLNEDFQTTTFKKGELISEQDQYNRNV